MPSPPQHDGDELRRPHREDLEDLGLLLKTELHDASQRWVSDVVFSADSQHVITGAPGVLERVDPH